MLSVIVCSNNEEKVASLRRSVESTVGSKFELIWVGNETSGKGICQLYNEGLAMSKGDILCFCHDDIRFNTVSWGLELLHLCSDQRIGLVGVAGAIYKSGYPTAWVDVPSKYYRVNMTQAHNNGLETQHLMSNKAEKAEVVILDGCFIAGRKQVFETFPWNEEALKGFHLYDIDLCVRVAQHFNLIVAGSISLTHFSEGNFNADWLAESEANHKANRHLLPLQTNAVKPDEAKRLDHYSLLRFSETLMRLGRSRKQVWQYGIKAIIKYPAMRSNYKLLKNMLKYLISTV